MKLHTLPLLLVAVFTSCSPSKSESSSKNAIKEYGIITEQEVYLDDCLSQKEEEYLIFFHSETCGHCREIIEDVVAFASSNIIKNNINISSNESSKLNKSSIKSNDKDESSNLWNSSKLSLIKKKNNIYIEENNLNLEKAHGK